MQDREPADPRVEDGDRQGRARLAHARIVRRRRPSGGRPRSRMRSPPSRPRRGSAARSGRAWRTPGERPRPPPPGARSRSAARALAPGGRRSRAGSARSGWRRPSAPRAAARGAGSRDAARARPRWRGRSRRPPRAPPARGRRRRPGRSPASRPRSRARPSPCPSRRGRRGRPRASASSSSSSRHILVVGWAPVPNAWPGSTTMSIAPARASAHEGRTQRRPPTSSGWWKSCQRSAQSSGISVGGDRHQPVAGDRLEVRQRRQLAGGAVDRVLDVAPSRAPPPPLPGPARPGRRAPARRAPDGSERRGGSPAAPGSGAAPRARPAVAVASSPSPATRPAARPAPAARLLRSAGTWTSSTTCWSPRAAPRSDGSPRPRSDDVLAGLGPRRDLDLALAVEGRDGHRAAEHRSSGGQLDDRDQLLAVALEALVLGNQHLHVEVPGPAAGLARVAGAGDPDSLARLDPRRDLDLPGAHADGPSLASALLAGRLGHPALAAAGRAGAGPHHLTEGDPASPRAARRCRRTSRRSGSASRARRRCPGSARRSKPPRTTPRGRLP